MTQLKSLTCAPLPKLTAADPIVHRRNKLVVRLQQQIALFNDPNFTLMRPKWIADEHGVNSCANYSELDAVLAQMCKTAVLGKGKRAA
jgi:hypothetical protein